MIDLKDFREHSDKYQHAADVKGVQISAFEILAADELYRQLLTRVEQMRSTMNQISAKIAKAQQTERQKLIKEASQVKEQLKDAENEFRKSESVLQTMLDHVPNVPLDEVPVGKDESGNQEIRQWGDKPTFDFKTRDHIELGKMHDWFDFERGAKVAGFRGYFLKNEAVILQFALLWFAFQKIIQKGYSPFIAPALTKEIFFYGSGHFPWGKKEAYPVLAPEGEKEEVREYIAGTAEVPMMGYHKNEVFDVSDLPKKYVAFSPCFRREIGSYGKDTHGAYRVHEFMKIEQVILSDNDIEHSRALHEELLKNSEEILQDLGLHYRVLLMCTGDMGEPQMKKYDIETWMPGRGNYGETMSDSIMGDFQCRRLNIKYRNGKILQYCHSLNNTALATPRILIALMEQLQQSDGSIKVPKPLQSLVGKDILMPRLNS